MEKETNYQSRFLRALRDPIVLGAVILFVAVIVTKLLPNGLSLEGNLLSGGTTGYTTYETSTTASLKEAGESNFTGGKVYLFELENKNGPVRIADLFYLFDGQRYELGDRNIASQFWLSGGTCSSDALIKSESCELQFTFKPVEEFYSSFKLVVTLQDSAGNLTQVSAPVRLMSL